MKRRARYLQCAGEEWHKARMACLVRDGFRCQAERLGLGPCDEERLRCLVVHHIRPRIAGGTHHLRNLVTLCRRHHAEIHPHLQHELEGRLPEIAYPRKEL